MKKQLLVSIVMGALFLGWGCQRRATSGRRVNPPSQSRGGGAEATVAVIFSTGDREIIIEFARGKRSGLPPGLAKKDRLPPGLERQLRRNAQLPPGLQKRLTPFPSALEAELGRLPGGARRVFLGNRALILSAANLILDIFLYR